MTSVRTAARPATSIPYALTCPAPDEPENAPVPEDDASDESPAVQPESAPADTCDAPDPTPGEQSAALPTADSYSFADGFETKIGRQNCRPIRMWTGGDSPFLYPLEPYR